MDPIIPEGDEQAQQVRALDASQTEAESGPNYAEKAGLTGPNAKVKPWFASQMQGKTSWGSLVKDHPVLSSHLVDPSFAAAAKDDVPQLSKIERLFGGWNEMLWKSKLELESDSRNQELAKLGHAMRAGTATPEQLKRGDELDAEAQGAEAGSPKMGFVPGIVPSVVGALPGMARALPVAGWYGLAGLAGGLALTKNEKAGMAAAGAMAGAGLTVGMARDTALTEMGLAYRQYVKAGADPKTAGVAADIVGLANGGLQAIPVQKVLNLAPGISNLLAGKKTRDIMSALITSNTGRAALGRFAGRVAESGLLMALVGGGQELVREIGAMGAGAKDEAGAPESLHGGRIWDASVGGMQQGLGFGIGHGIAPLVHEQREARIGIARGEMFKAIAGEAANSKLREQMPEAFKRYVNAVVAEHGNVEEAKAPAEKITALLQAEGVSDEQLEASMPTVAKQLKNAGPKDEIVIPMGDLATHLAPLKSFPEFSQDLRVGDDSLTPREAKKIPEMADKFEKENKAPKEEKEPAPGRKVFEDVYDQLVKAGQDPEVARKDASLWQAFATTRGERMGIDPFEYYQKRNVKIGTEFPDSGTTLGQPKENPAFKKWFGGSQAVDENGSPKKMYHGTIAPEDFKEFSMGEPRVLDENEGISEWGSGADPSAYVGSHFAEEPEVASKFARPGGLYQREGAEGDGAGPRVIPVFLKAEKPKIYAREAEFQKELYATDVNSPHVDEWIERQEDPDHAAEQYQTDVEFREEANREIITELNGEDDPSLAQDFARDIAYQYRQELQKQGFDSIKYANEGEGGTSWAVFDPSQIKSAIGNSGEFDPSNPNILEQPAYHGSPHHFSKFTLDHIGTGEGAQMFGWGLYFAEQREIAEYYKDTLSQASVKIPGMDVQDSPAYFAVEALNAVAGRAVKGDTERLKMLAIEHEKEQIKSYKQQIAEWAGNDDKVGPLWLDDQIQLHEESLRHLEALDPSEIEHETGGHLYEVEIPDKEDLLDYEKRFTRQPKAIKEKILAYLEEENRKYPSFGSKEFREGKLQEMTGVELYRYIGAGDDKTASDRLLDAGIPGLKFLDNTSRNEPRVNFHGDRPSAWSFSEPDKAINEISSALLKRVDRGEEIESAFNNELASFQERAKTLTEEASKATENANRKNEGLRFRDPGYDSDSMIKADELRSKAYHVKKIAEWMGTLHPDDFSFDEGTHNFVIWNEDAIQTLNVFEQRGGEAGSDGYRGKISFDDARSFFNITLTGKANLSTFLHESGHAFLEFLRMDAQTHLESAKDFRALLDWFGTKPGEQPSTEQLEQFARGFESYLREGKAPSPELRGLFRTFSAWLKSVYKSISSLGVTLTDEVRGVMDRMLATDSEIEKARQGLGLEPMKKPEGMSDSEYKAYTEKFGKAMEAGRTELEEVALREFRNTIGEERAKVQADVEASTKLDPAHNAYEALRTGKRLDGEPLAPEVAGQKLDREAVAEAGHKGIKWVSITSKDGLDPEVAAPYLGYENGPALLDALEARRSRSKEIKEETERRMMEKYPNADIAKMSEQAVTALHLKDEVGNVLWLEAKAIGKRIGAEDPRTAKAVVKEIARRRTAEMTALEMQPGRFARGEERAAGEWADAMKAKDFEEAHRAKLDQILNHEMFKAVQAAKEEVDSIRTYLDGFNELPMRRRLGKAGEHYTSAVDAIIGDIELKRQTGKTLERRASLESYLSKMEAEDGALITIPAELRSEAALKNYKQMTLDELRTARDAVANIETMARLKNKLFDGRERRAFQETAVRMAETVKANLGDTYAEKPGAPQNPGWLDKKKAMLRRSVAEMKKIEFLARSMDGGETAGKIHELIFQPFATAEANALTLKKNILDVLIKPLREMGLKERAEFDRTVDFLGTPMKLRDVIAVALNMGNEGNKKKLLDGYLYRGWNEEKVVARLGELLSDKHLDLIEHFWKTIGSLWPDIKSLSERTVGIAPPKVEASKLTIRGRELEGGYYPIVYDRERSYKAEQFAQKKGDLFENNFLKPGVSKGFTESRTQFAAPLLLSLNIIPAHMNEVIHYLTHLEPVRAVDRLMGHPEVRRAVTEALGRETYNLFRPWLQAIAHEGVVSSNTTAIDNVLRHLRVGAGVTRLGFKLSNSIMQGFNILSSVKELGGWVEAPKYLVSGVEAWTRALDGGLDPFKDVHEQSPEIRGKTEKYEANLVGNFDHFTSAFSEFGAMKEKLGHFALSFMTFAWKSVEAMTWYAAREKAFDLDHPRPNEYADSVVRLSQMGEGMKDKAAIMRGGEGTKIFTYMYSWYSTIFNQLTEKQPQMRGGWAKAGEHASRYWWMILAPTVMMSLARGKHAKHDDGEMSTEAAYLGKEIALETAKGYLGPIGGVAADTMLSGQDAKFAPWISTVLRGMVVRGKMTAGKDLTDHEKKDLFESTGIVSHLPAGGAYNLARYIQALQDGKLEEPVRDLLFRGPGEWK